MLKIFVLLCLLCFFSSSFHIRTKQQQTNKKRKGVAYTIFSGIYPDENLPAGSIIYLRGDNCNLTWTKGVPLKKTAANTWATSMLCPNDVAINVKLLINDTKWMMGANYNFMIKANESSPTITIYPSFNPSINDISDIGPISSSILGNQRKVSLYFPPSYLDNKFKKYQLLIMHDGQNLFDPSKAAFGVAWMCQNTTTLLIAEGKIRQVIIAGIWNTNQRTSQYTYSYDKSQKSGGKGDLYLDFIQKELMPKLRNQHLAGRILQDKGLIIGGSSLGGLISCYAAYTRPLIYSKAICMSSSFWWNNEDFKNVVIKSKPYNSSTTLYLDSGDSGSGQDNKASTDNAKAALLALGYKQNTNLFYYLDKGAQHNQYYWGKRFSVPMIDIFGV